jgi:hypothetical protein
MPRCEPLTDSLRKKAVSSREGTRDAGPGGGAGSFSVPAPGVSHSTQAIVPFAPAR